jgi:hypothetical protein
MYVCINNQIINNSKMQQVVARTAAFSYGVVLTYTTFRYATEQQDGKYKPLAKYEPLAKFVRPVPVSVPYDVENKNKK